MKKRKGRYPSGLKELRKSKKREKINKRIKKQLKKITKELEAAIAKKDIEKARKILPRAFSLWDKAAKRRTIHPNKAARKKSRLSIKINQLASELQASSK